MLFRVILWVFGFLKLNGLILGFDLGLMKEGMGKFLVVGIGL